MENLKRFGIMKKERGVEELSNMKKTEREREREKVLLSVLSKLLLLSDDIKGGIMLNSFKWSVINCIVGNRDEKGPTYPTQLLAV